MSTADNPTQGQVITFAAPAPESSDFAALVRARAYDSDYASTDLQLVNGPNDFLAFLNRPKLAPIDTLAALLMPGLMARSSDTSDTLVPKAYKLAEQMLLESARRACAAHRESAEVATRLADLALAEGQQQQQTLLTPEVTADETNGNEKPEDLKKASGTGAASPPKDTTLGDNPQAKGEENTDGRV